MVHDPNQPRFLDPEWREKFLAEVRLGIPPHRAAEYLGVVRKTLYDWFRRSSNTTTDARTDKRGYYFFRHEVFWPLRVDRDFPRETSVACDRTPYAQTLNWSCAVEPGNRHWSRAVIQNSLELFNPR